MWSLQSSQILLPILLPNSDGLLTFGVASWSRRWSINYDTLCMRHTLSPFKRIWPGAISATDQTLASRVPRHTERPSLLLWVRFCHQFHLDGVVNHEVHVLVEALDPVSSFPAGFSERVHTLIFPSIRNASCSKSQTWTVECCCRSLKMKLMGGTRTLRPPPPPPPPRPDIVSIYTRFCLNW
jgi:hypothetical protein